MTSESAPDQLPIPQFVIDPDAAEEQVTALHGLERMIIERPVAASQGLRIHNKDPETVQLALGFLKENPEGNLAILEGWTVTFASKADGLIRFDDATENAIAENPDYKKLKKEFDQLGSDPIAQEKKAQQIRTFRISRFISRAIAAQRQQQRNPAA